MQIVWERLSMDVALWGGFRSPLLSWLGVAALAIFFVWHVSRLIRNVRDVRQAYARVQPTVTDLTAGRDHVDGEWLSIRALGEASRTANQSIRIDLDDVHVLDRLLRAEPLFQRAWAQFRKTYVLERTSWFIEPRVFSTKSAEEYFSHEQVLAARVNIAFYHQLPSLMTGMGLLFTFLAILIGLSKLHADATQIVGIQGLINGLAGKFLTSIVGLICANAFVMVEKSVLFGLASDHRRFVLGLDELFPRRTLEQMLENCSSVGGGEAPSTLAPGAAPAGKTETTDSLAPSIQALTKAMESLTKRTSEGRGMEPARAAAEVARGVRDGLSSPMQDLQKAIQSLSQSVGQFQATQERTQLQLDKLSGRLALKRQLADTMDEDEAQETAASGRWWSAVRSKAASRESA